MNRLKYLFAGVYKQLKEKKPDGSPMFNLKCGIVFIIIMHLAELGAIIRIYTGINVFQMSTGLAWIIVLTVGTLLYFIVNAVIPSEELMLIKVADKDAKRSYYVFFGYFFLNVFLLLCLMLLLRSTLIRSGVSIE